jgi:hypothetical protein
VPSTRQLRRRKTSTVPVTPVATTCNPSRNQRRFVRAANRCPQRAAQIATTRTTIPIAAGSQVSHQSLGPARSPSPIPRPKTMIRSMFGAAGAMIITAARSANRSSFHPTELSVQ